MNSNWSYSPETPNLSQNRRFLSRVTLPFDVWPFKNNRATLLCYFKLCASFRSHWWIQTGVAVRKRSFWVKIDNFISRVTLKFPVWPWKSIGHLFYATSSFVHHSEAIGKFKLELQCPILVNFDDFENCVTLKFDGWPRKTIGHLFYATSSFVHHFVAIGDFKLEIQSRNAQFGSKSMVFRAMWPCHLTYDLRKQSGTPSMLLQALCIIS